MHASNIRWLKSRIFISSWFSGACVFHVFQLLSWFVVPVSEASGWGNYPAAVFRAHNRPKKALSSSFATRWHTCPFLMLFAIGCVFQWPTCRARSCDQSIAVRSNNNANVVIMALDCNNYCIYIQQYSLYMGSFRRSRSEFGIYVCLLYTSPSPRD